MKITYEFACQDDCLDKIVPSDLRQLVCERDQAYVNVSTLIDQHSMLQDERDALAAQVDILQKEKSDLLVYVADSEKWFNKHDPNGYVSPKRSTAQQCLRDVRIDAVKEFVDFNKGRFTNAFDMYISDAFRGYDAKVQQGGAE